MVIQITLHTNEAAPPNFAHIFVTFDNGFQTCGYFHADTEEVVCVGAENRRYLFTGVKSWFTIPKDCY